MSAKRRGSRAERAERPERLDRALDRAQVVSARQRRGRPPRTGSERAAHRARLVDAAMMAVRRYGSDASIDQMADVAGVSKPVLYSEFGGKLGLVDAIAVQLAERVERAVVSTLLERRSLDLDGVIEAIVDALISLIEEEPELYSFLVRNIRMSDRGFLDNSLVSLIHERASLVIGLVATEADEDELAVLVDGVFGFVFSVVESWLRNPRLPKDRLVKTIATVIRAGLVEITGWSASRSPAVASTVTKGTLHAG